MCKCLTVHRSESQLWGSFTDEIGEVLENPVDPKEWSDVAKASEDLIERYFGSKIYLGSGMNRVQQRINEEDHQCIRSRRNWEKNGGRCLSE